MTIASQLHKLLSQGISGNQAQLVKILDRQGVKTTQSTVSRALKKINAVKGLDASGRVIYSLPPRAPAPGQPPVFESLVYRIEHNGHLVVIHTRPGTANTVAKFIDDRGLKEVLGSVAGDDTIMIAPRDISRTGSIAGVLEAYLKEIGVF